MRLVAALNMALGDLKAWGLALSASAAEALKQRQTGQHRAWPVPLADGRQMIGADVTVHETDLFAEGLPGLDPADVQPLRWSAAVAMMADIDPDDPDARNPPQWEQILGAGLGPVGAEDGFPLQARVMHEGVAWLSRVPNNVNAPSSAVSSTWSRLDGTHVIPAGWQYQPGEDLTEDGGATWFRVTQATSFSPSQSPAQYVPIDGRGGEPSVPVEPEGAQAWVRPTGGHDAYPAGAMVTHSGATWENTHGDGNVWEPGVFGWTEVMP